MIDENMSEQDGWRLTADGKMFKRGHKKLANGDMYDGEWVDGHRWGKGTYTYANGDQYIGEFEQDQWHGFGVHTRTEFKDKDTGETVRGWRYEGSFKHGLKDGEGLLLLGTGASFEGEFARDKFEGQGTYSYANGDKCEGQWRRGKRHGLCMMAWANGDRYEGQYVEDRPQGQGEYRWRPSIGGSYKGGYFAGLKHGLGKRIYTDGSSFEGEFKDDMMNGEGVLRYANGDVYLGQFSNNLVHGTGVRTYAHGDRYEGQWLRGVFYGKGVYTYADGSFYDGEYLAVVKHAANGCTFPRVDGKRHGRGVRVWVSGNRYDGQWEGDEMSGRGTFTMPKDSASYERYEGDFFRSKRHGYGVCLSRQCRYEGQWRSNMRHGSGKQEGNDGIVYEGQWFCDKRHGHGTQTMVPRAERGAGPERYFTGGVGYLYRVLRYEGEWLDDRRTGYGAVVYTNGDALRGTLENGRFSGICVYRYASGWEKGGMWKGGSRVRWLTEAEEQERLQREVEQAAASADAATAQHTPELLQRAAPPHKGGGRRPSTGQLQLSPLPPRPPPGVAT